MVDPCLPFVIPPSTLELDVSTPLSDCEYSVATASQSYQIPAFTLSPSWCTLTYSFVSITPALPNASVVSFDPSTRTFTFDDQATDLSTSSTIVAAPYEVSYTVKVQGEVSSVTTPDTSLY